MNCIGCERPMRQIECKDDIDTYQCPKCGYINQCMCDFDEDYS